MQELKLLIENLWEDRTLINEVGGKEAIREVVDMVDQGKLRVAEPDGDGWKVNDWVKKAIVLFFPIQKMETIEVGLLNFTTKFHSKKITQLKVYA